jgi:hypothetical protein
MVRKKEEAKSKDSGKSGKDAPKKERLSVSAFLSNIDKPKPAVAPKPKAKAAPAASAYTSGLDLPPSDDEDEVFLPVLLLFLIVNRILSLLCSIPSLLLFSGLFEPAQFETLINPGARYGLTRALELMDTGTSSFKGFRACLCKP